MLSPAPIDDKPGGSFAMTGDAGHSQLNRQIDPNTLRVQLTMASPRGCTTSHDPVHETSPALGTPFGTLLQRNLTPSADTEIDVAVLQSGALRRASMVATKVALDMAPESIVTRSPCLVARNDKIAS